MLQGHNLLEKLRLLYPDAAFACLLVDKASVGIIDMCQAGRIGNCRRVFGIICDDHRGLSQIFRIAQRCHNVTVIILVIVIPTVFILTLLFIRDRHDKAMVVFVTRTRKTHKNRIN